ncbi:MAG: RES family NAD+ phosphorylase [Rhodospirillales bacterium]
MSSNISTPAALSSEARALSGTCWRLVEAQHRVSTLKLVDSVEEQQALEELVQATKPALPPECAKLHYLLATPFRYGALYPTGSRFRRAGLSEGVFYATEAPHTAVAEMVFYRLLFYAESPDTPWPANAAEYTGFAAAFATDHAIDLTAGKLARNHGQWTHLTDYAPCQALADLARAANIDVIRYASVRDPRHGMNLALLRCEVFTKPKPVSEQSWHIRLSAAGAQAVCEAPKAGITFGRDAFAADPRLAKMKWQRG